MEEEQRVAQVEVAKQRCKWVIDAIDKLPCSTNITHSCKRTLLKLARAELAFLSRPSSSSGPLRVVPDTPSERMMGLPTTRKLALKNKVVFGTGDHWHAPTLTANMAFVRAVSQTGMSLSTIEHRPRALTGD